ncbi:uncharacterized protein LODBEIA_P30040 [Lodderomyces beijingensis]|uniref:Thioredoxin n=1 Tax=Lodderomyces beijingensis TaxID=1775926 RepID=A0ABP0ZNJ2_9ASCO
MPVQFTKSPADFDHYLNNNKVVVANFTASWCGPCQAVKPVIDRAYDIFTSVEIVKVDLDTQRELASKYTVTAVPTFIFFEDGKEAARVRGANVEQVMQELQKFNQRAAGESRKGNGKASGSSSSTLSSAYSGIRELIPPGFDILNSSIDFGSFEALNAKAVYEGSKVHDIFKLSSSGTGSGTGSGTTSTVVSDSDSQMMFSVPFLNISKVYSVLIKVNRSLKKENLAIDEEDLNEIQPPNIVKAWPNLQHPLSFEDASADSKAPLAESIDVAAEAVSEKWIEIKLKYVKFQNVQNLFFFFDGEDEDAHSAIEKVLIVGVNGDSKEQKTLGSLEQEG